MSFNLGFPGLPNLHDSNSVLGDMIWSSKYSVTMVCFFILPLVLNIVLEVYELVYREHNDI